jgi:hypothetical protein
MTRVRFGSLAATRGMPARNSAECERRLRAREWALPMGEVSRPNGGCLQAPVKLPTQ